MESNTELTMKSQWKSTKWNTLTTGTVSNKE